MALWAKALAITVEEENWLANVVFRPPHEYHSVCIHAHVLWQFYRPLCGTSQGQPSGVRSLEYSQPAVWFWLVSDKEETSYTLKYLLLNYTWRSLKKKKTRKKSPLLYKCFQYTFQGKKFLALGLLKRKALYISFECQNSSQHWELHKGQDTHVV